MSRPPVLAVFLASVLSACASHAGVSDSASPAAASASADPCSGGEVELAALLEMSPEDRLGCFGSRTVTFRAYVSSMVGAGTCDFSPVPGGGWLNLCGGPHRILVMAPGDEEGLTAYLPPSLDADEVPVETWLVATGHFDDPAAATCDREIAGEPANDPAQAEMCRLAFVLDSVVPSE